VIETAAGTAAPDRRTALKERHRGAILAAARTLIDERSGPRFTVDELADRADVARRTIFNHFSSLDEVVLTVCADELNVVVDEFLATVAGVEVGDGSRAAVFDELAQAIYAADLPRAIRRVSNLIDMEDTADARAGFLAGTAFTRVGGRLSEEISRRYHGADPLDVELLVGSLMSGLAVIATRWLARTGARSGGRTGARASAGARTGDADRAEWDALLARLLDSIRSGYMPRAEGDRSTARPT